MLIKCNNPACDKKIDTNKSHTIRYDSGVKLYFCSDACDISYKYIFDFKNKSDFHKIADAWKKVIEKNFRKFYDFMPEFYFNFMKPLPKPKMVSKFPNIYTILEEIKFEELCRTSFPNDDDFVSQNAVFSIVQKFYRNILDRNKESWDEKVEKDV